MSDPLISVDEAKAQARISSTDEDDQIEAMTGVATDIVISALLASTSDSSLSSEIASWDEDSVPNGVKVAILTQFMELYRFRGDEEPPKANQGHLSQQVERFLTPWMDAPIA